MPTSFLTRTATAQDVDALVALVNSAYRGESSRAGWTTETDLVGGSRVDAERLQSAVASPDDVILVHEANGEMLACVHLQRTGTDDCYLGMLTTKPTRQGGGLGKQMLEAAERVARDTWGATVMHMTVITIRTELVAFYERRGYVKSGERKPFPYEDPRMGLPKRGDLEFYVLRKSLTSIT